MDLATNRPPVKSSPYDFTTARRALVQEFGKETILKLHRKNRFLDFLAVWGSWALLFGLAWLIGTLEPLSAGWIAAFVAQGFVIMAFGYILHDLYVHRYVGGRRFAYWMGLATGFVAYLIRTPYAIVHHDHHNHTGTDEDEAYKDDIDSRWKRLLFCTPVGYLLAFRRQLKSERPPRFPSPDNTFAVYDHEDFRRYRRERRMLRVFWLLLIVGAIFLPRFVLLGYILPLLIVLPLANVMRTILEHGETNPDNTFHCATYYRTGPVTRPLFFWDAGDCHLVHHIFPNIPFYKVGVACDLFRPFLLKQGVRERRSLLGLLYGYFVRNERHRALWST